jgi:Tol biopolymer transport system component
LIRPDGGGLRGVAGTWDGAWTPLWAQDGRRIVVNAEQGASIVSGLEPDATPTHEPLARASDGTNFWLDSWSPDGSLAAGTNYRDGAARGISVHSLSDRSFKQVATGDVQRPSFTADGRHLIANAGDAIVRYDMATLRPEVMIEAPAGRTFVHPTLSADRRWLAFVELGDESDIWLATLDDAVPVQDP